jgi:hypothetical protein
MVMLQNGAVSLTPPEPPKRWRPQRRPAIVTAMIVAAIVILLAVVYWGGTVGSPTRQQLIGTWISNDQDVQSTLVLEQDGSARVTNLVSQKQELSFTATWYVTFDGLVLQSSQLVDGAYLSITLPTRRTFYQPIVVNYPDAPTSLNVRQIYGRG